MTCHSSHLESILVMNSPPNDAPRRHIFSSSSQMFRFSRKIIPSAAHSKSNIYLKRILIKRFSNYFFYDISEQNKAKVRIDIFSANRVIQLTIYEPSDYLVTS